jgi:hypothetical protein
MKKLLKTGLEFEVDKLTNSIENIVTGDSFATDISIISISDLMKHKSKELDVDFIGGENPMTKEEEKAISEFIKAQKLLSARKQIRNNKTTQRSKSIA